MDNSKKTVLVTGGAGYIGSHMILLLLKEYFNVISVDNYSNSSIESLQRIEKFTNKKINKYNCDLLDKSYLKQIFRENTVDSVIHFAGLKSVSESIKYPLKYYENNVTGSLNLLEIMVETGVKKIIFSSSATVYGRNIVSPCDEYMELSETTNPYGESKAIIERIIQDTVNSVSEFNSIILRYFNPVGADSSGVIGESPLCKPENLVPFLAGVIQGEYEKLYIYGTDYPTKDGTGLRDYIHVSDLVECHLKALNYNNTNRFEVFNVGTGKPVSVLELLNEFSTEINKSIPYEIVGRRDGDLAEVWANNQKAIDLLGWKPTRTVKDMVKDTLNWLSQNKNMENK